MNIYPEVQRALTPSLMFETAFVGNRGVKLTMIRTFNSVDRVTGVRPNPFLTRAATGLPLLLSETSGIAPSRPDYIGGSAITSDYSTLPGRIVPPDALWAMEKSADPPAGM